MVGKTVSHYKIFKKLGEGGMGVMYEVRHAELDRLVALKFSGSSKIHTNATRMMRSHLLAY